MRFLVDAQLPPALAHRLSGLGHEAEYVNRIGLGGSGDRAMWAHAGAQNLALITKDEDFIALARSDRDGPQVVWVRLGNTTNRALWRALEPVMTELVSSLESGERIVEIA